jgi:hypothetical protein
MSVECCLDNVGGQNIGFPAAVAVLFDVGLGTVVAGLDLDALTQAWIGEVIHLLACQPDADDLVGDAEAV